MKNTARGTGPRGRVGRGVRRAGEGVDKPAASGGGTALGPVWQVEVANRQRRRVVDTRRLAGWARAVLSELPGLQRATLSVCLLGDRAMAELNETFVGHSGPTDVITFDYAEGGGTGRAGVLAGEICMGVEEAVRQARRFRTDWSRELARYLIHGILHLRGYDDAGPSARRRMKREEDRLLRRLERRVGRLSLRPGGRARRRAPLVERGTSS